MDSRFELHGNAYKEFSAKKAPEESSFSRVGIASQSLAKSRIKKNGTDSKRFEARRRVNSEVSVQSYNPYSIESVRGEMFRIRKAILSRPV
jgi:hypothetical protein